MGLFDKIKDLFTDEEEVYETKEIEIEEKEEEHKLPTFMRNKLEKEEQEKEINILEEPIKEEVKEVVQVVEDSQTQEENKFPFAFEEDDFIEQPRFSRTAHQCALHNNEKIVEKIEPQVKPYGNKKEAEKPKKFRPTPVISPVYGVLDKNYKTEEVVSKDEDAYAIPRASKKVDFESVRNKAYGILSDDAKDNSLCENCELLKEIKVSKKIERLSKEDLLYNNSCEKDESNEKEVRKDLEITLGEATENYEDYGMLYEVPPQRSRINNDVKIVNHALEDVVAEKVVVREKKETIKKESKYEQAIENKKAEDLELTDDLFNLIDSMYKERND